MRRRFHMYAEGVGIALPKRFLNAWGSGIGYAKGFGIGSIGMPRGLHRFYKYAKGHGIGFIGMLGGAWHCSTNRDLSFECQGSCIGNAKGPGIGSA